METHKSIFMEMTPADRWIFVGNLITAVGFMAISVGTTLRLVTSGNLPSGRPVVGPNTADTSTTARDGNRAREHFS